VFLTQEWWPTITLDVAIESIKKFLNNTARYIPFLNQKIMKEEKEEVCIFTLPDVVLLPGVVMPIHIFEDRYRKMTDFLLQTDAVLAMNLETDNQILKDKICGGGKVSLLQNYNDGRKDIVVAANKRLKILDVIQESPYIRAQAIQVPDVPFASAHLEQFYQKELNLLVKKWIFLNPELHDDYLEYLNLFREPHHLADFIGFYFLPNAQRKQSLLENVDRKKRVESIIMFIEDEIRILSKRDPEYLAGPREFIKTYH
jgi:ATP-dependent Lon protease